MLTVANGFAAVDKEQAMTAQSKLIIAAACALAFAAPAAQAAGDPVHIFVNLGSVANERMILPPETTLRVGHTYQFVVSNPSEETHVVSAPELAANADTVEIRTDDELGERAIKGSPSAAIAKGIPVAPGQMLQWTLTPRMAGTFKFGCEEPQHKASGMTQTVRVVAGT